MATATRKRTRIDKLDEGDWLQRLLTSEHQRVATHPSPQAIGRIRQRLLAEMQAPTRAAA